MNENEMYSVSTHLKLRGLTINIFMTKLYSRKKESDLKEWSAPGRPVSSFREFHVLQVSIDYHQKSEHGME